MALGPAESGKDWAMGTDYTSPLVTADVESVSTKVCWKAVSDACALIDCIRAATLPQLPDLEGLADVMNVHTNASFVLAGWEGHFQKAGLA